MPSTLNGIGTHYYGKKNHSSRTAACRSCNRVGNLESYDTRLWFVIVFIPIIPLGRKRILDACPSCTRHYVVKADVYEENKKAQTAASLEQFRQQPSPESALQTHGLLLAFHEPQQAAEFRQTALPRFPHNAGLRVTMAAQLREMMAFEESVQLYLQALKIDPKLPEARIGVALWRIGEGNFEEAKQLLDFLMKPGAGRSYGLGSLDFLMTSLQKAGQHDEALAIAEVLLREEPARADDSRFRSLVKRSEKAAGKFESILPERGFSLSGLFSSAVPHDPPWIRKLVVGGGVALLIAGGLALSNEYIKQHRTLHVLNASGETAFVQVDDQPAVPVVGLGRLTVSEGAHVVKVTGAVTETQQVTLDSNYFGRWFNNPVWVLNLGGEGVLEEIIHHYAINPAPSERRIVMGETFFTQPNYDYIFTPAPNQLKVKNRNQEITKSEISWIQGEDFNVFRETIGNNHLAAMKFAEKRLRRNPNQPDLLRSYVGQADDHERARVEEFLKSEINRRPVNIPWHRDYQSLAELNHHAAELIAIYDKFLESEPNNAALIYLRGRIDPDWARQEEFYRKASQVDPKLGWPWLAVASRAGSAGKWDECFEATLKARGMNINEPDRINELLHIAAMGKGEAKSLVAQYQLTANANNQNLPALLDLIDALAGAGREEEIEPAVKTWVARLPAQLQGQVAIPLRAVGLYHAGKLEECVKLCQSNPMAKSSPSHFHALIALGRLSEAAEDPAFAGLREDPSNLLALSVGSSLQGKAEDAARWREKTLVQFQKLGDLDIGKITKFLSSKESPTLEEINKIYLTPEAKTLLLVALADRFPDRREIYLAEAKRFNIRHKPPYQLIRRATGPRAAG